MLVALVLRIGQDLLAFAQPQLLRLLLLFIPRFQDSNFREPLVYNNRMSGLSDGSPTQRVPLIEGFAIAALMFVAALAQTVLQHQVRNPKPLP